MRPVRLVVALCLTAVLAPASASAAPLPLPLPGGTQGPAPQAYRQGDFGAGGFHDVLPPGTNGLANLAQLGAFEIDKTTRPAHSDDQLRMYADLVYGSPGLKARDLGRYYKDSSFGVKPGDLASTISPRSDVTILRDKSFGVPHVYGATRAGVMFGAGYVAAQDRLFFIDVLRHLGRAQLSSFAGGAEGNRAMDADVWANEPYTEDDLQRQVDQLPRLYGAEGAQVRSDAQSYVDGINQYISEAQLDLSKMPGEYKAIGQNGPAPWKLTDVIATATLVGGIFGKGGGRELSYATLLQGFRKRFGTRAGTRLWSEWRSAQDPESPTTVHNGRRFSYEPSRRGILGRQVALPDAGSVRKTKQGGGSQATGRAAGTGAPSGLAGLLAHFPNGNSNALVVSRKLSKTKRPLAVFGPQVAYFNPEILMEEDLHGPGIDARGASFPGVNFYVELGRGPDYAWSATSAGQDIIDTYAVPLCQPGGKATKESNFYRFRGRCLPMETLTRTNSFVPNAADQTPPGTQTLTTQRTKLGIVTARATVRGRPVAYTNLRSTYFHEVDSARGFKDFNEPAKIRNARAYQRAASKIGYTFNWLYTDNRDVAYFNSGNNPVRPRGQDTNLPIMASRATEWKRFNPDLNTAAYTPFAQHPQVINQDYITSWNNKQAPGFAGADTNIYTSIYRSQSLDDNIRARTRHGRKLTLVGLVDAMENAGTVDLRGTKVLPSLLRVIGRPRDRRIAAAVRTLRAWVRHGAHRRDLKPRDGRYDDAAAVQLMDAWWVRLLPAQFGPVLGRRLYAQTKDVIAQDNPPVGSADEHHGSAYQDGWYGYVQKDLRALLHQRVRGAYHRRYCGAGSLARCRRALERSLLAASRVPTAQVYRDPLCAKAKHDGSQTCFDSISFRPLGALTQPLIPWINRPTYQQAIDVPGHRRR